MADPEVWLRGALDDVAPELMPVAHSLLQVREEIESVVPSLSGDELFARPGGAASIAFHVRHLAGSLDRLLTYARGETLTAAQQAWLNEEGLGRAEGGDNRGYCGQAVREGAAALVAVACDAIDRALSQVRRTPVDSLNDARRVGRAGLPSTVRGLLFHAAEHAQRHAGQIVTTARIVRGLASASD